MIVKLSANISYDPFAGVGEEVGSQETESGLRSEQSDKKQRELVQLMRIAEDEGGVYEHAHDLRKRQP